MKVPLQLRALVDTEMRAVMHNQKPISSVDGGGGAATAAAGATAAAATSTTTTTAADRAAFIRQRKRDALMCYLKTCCERLRTEIVLGADDSDAEKHGH